MGDFNDTSGDVIAKIPTEELIGNNGILRDIRISNSRLIEVLEKYINWNKAIYNCQIGFTGSYREDFQIKMGLDKATNHDHGQDLVIYNVNGATLTFEYYWIHLD